ncbi:hypothetical protein EYF80_003650 [Liparis tanakae]|uniref:Uncharacterized protein n=1 Tax=Liparis tanakae TaxID=230148 RepID=A0A4Z2J982_9TELE|nr:hypothetical protein EYF80_003650 [Liparis tanakae]
MRWGRDTELASASSLNISDAALTEQRSSSIGSGEDAGEVGRMEEQRGNQLLWDGGDISSHSLTLGDKAPDTWDV